MLFGDLLKVISRMFIIDSQITKTLVTGEKLVINKKHFAKVPVVSTKESHEAGGCSRN